MSSFYIEIPHNDLSGFVTIVTASGVLSSSGGTDPNITLTGIVPLANGGTGVSTLVALSSELNLSGSNTGDVTLTNVGASPNANGASLAGQVLTLQPATSTSPGVLTASDYNLFNSKVTDAQIYYHYPVVAGVVENDIVMNQTSLISGQAPLAFKKAVNGDTNYYPQLYGIAKNVSGGFADIYLGQGSVVSGFNFGAFVGVDYYIDPAVPGGLTFTPPAGQVNAIKVGRALDSTHLILDPVGAFVQDKGALYTSDGSGYDNTIVVGSNGQVLIADSPSLTGLKWAAAVVVSAPFTYNTATRTLTAATATNSVAGFLSAADHTTFAAAAPLASPAFTGTPSLPTGTTGITQAAGNSTTALATTAFVTTADNLKANLASPTFTGTPTLPTGTIGVTQAAGNSTTALATTAFTTTANNLKANIASPTFTGDINSSTGNILISTIGKGLQVKTGANSKIGTAALAGGTVTVANTSVTANSIIFLTSQANGGTPGFLRITAKTAATSFVVTSSSATDTSTIGWMIVESIP